MTNDDKTIYNDPACKKCHGQGVYYPGNPDCGTCSGSGWDEEFPCGCVDGGVRHCDCHYEQKIRVMTARARIPAKNLASRVANFKPETKTEQDNRDAIVKWLESFPNVGALRGFLLEGPPGTGKTHMATAICNALIRRNGVQPLYASATQMMVRATARFDDKSMPDPFEYPTSVDVLVIDDLGAEKPSEWSIARFGELFDARYRDDLVTIVTSNLNIDDIEALYGPRITDRIHETCQFLHFNGRSRRRGN